ncbi:hypothetical protein PENANT_c004G00407 [Penicillium antarcticum]|uniref:Uncharacterized protein n=1 Tax=Penicillium antarcticum TaxID=416450 RepID=A0A1V6QHN3_9EURO|nr:uncharacterized protein N7508_002166 [Penicillium antarcticum]KAJ5317658.1 hypothetical protein N7508_002166 [Penicillium antarcticum]OQD88457.1 hypothetical protein PENANT_c004G00407 [Penicillium antarcticum]
MPPIRALSLGVPTSGLFAVGTFFYTTRHIEAVELFPSDPILNSKYHQDYNPNKNPTVHDLHIRTIPISQIDPALLQDEARLTQRFTGGVWAGFAFKIQRTLLTWFCKYGTTSHQLWSPSEMLNSKFDPGTVITDEFVVLEKLKDSVLIRGGDKVSNNGLRPLDALMELSVRAKPEEDSIQFGFKSLFFQGLGKSDKLPMPAPVIWLHEQYAKALLESGVRHVLQGSDQIE